MTTRIAFVGASSGVGTTTLAVNVAALLGVAARQKTLLLDVSGSRQAICQHLGIQSTIGLLRLTSPWLRDGYISPEELAQSVCVSQPSTRSTK